ncbi:hypothetical protein [Pseudohalocynthiibacter sp. F2068]|uniref:hypothetical protein n=1 Tax=Pseudohalocynthiibacter sp. F2068 TaxID=2926418 RepID=UPI001FF6F99E|nr:hypothetical protein [Pseudohalocynthiibacter sp. F2068]MCK0102348.1 hypothetical protein [Pseudohalocynthiibacter sp. F2068]
MSKDKNKEIVTDSEIAALKDKVLARREKAPNIKAEMVDGIAKLSIGDKDDEDDTLRLMGAMGVLDLDFLNPFLGQIGNSVSKKDEFCESSMKFAIGFIKSIEPVSEIEAMLAAQMAAVHVCAMDTSRRLLWASNLPQRDSAERALNKLTRTFTTQMDALKKHRAKAQQTVRVERVTVNEGGQAIVGSVAHGGRAEHEK